MSPFTPEAAPGANFICIPMFFLLSGSTCSRALPKQWHIGCASPESLSSALSVKGEIWHLWLSSLRASQAKLNYIHRWWSTKNIKNGLADLGRYELEFEWLDHVGGILQLVRVAPMWCSLTPQWFGYKEMRRNNILKCNLVFSNSFLSQSHQQLNMMCLTKALFTIMNCTVALYVSGNHRYLNFIHFFLKRHIFRLQIYCYVSTWREWWMRHSCKAKAKCLR